MFAEAIRVGCLFECQVKRLACGRRADDVVSLFAEAIQPADGFVQILKPTEGRVEIVEKLLL